MKKIVYFILYFHIIVIFKCEELPRNETVKDEIREVLDYILGDSSDENLTKIFNEKILVAKRPKSLIYESFDTMYNQVLNSNNSEEKQFKAYYFLEFYFIPLIIDEYRRGEYDESILTDKSFYSSFSPLSNEIKWNEIKIEQKIINEDTFEIIFDFGEPKFDNLCRFAILYYHKSYYYCEYIMLEKSDLYIKYPYYIGSINQDKHIDFNIEFEPELNIFEEFVIKFVKSKLEIERYKAMLYRLKQPKIFNVYYSFYFTYLPILFYEYEEKIKNNTQFNEDDYLLNKDNSTFLGIDWSKFNFYKKELDEGVIEYIYDFGEPMASPLCRFGIFYVDKKNEIYEYFTLEKAKVYDKYKYVVCGKKRHEKHKNYLYSCNDELEVFEEIIQIIIEKNFLKKNKRKELISDL